MRLTMIPGYFNKHHRSSGYSNQNYQNYQSLAVQRNLDMVRDMQHLAMDTLWKYDQSTSVHATRFNEAYRNLRCWAKAHGIFGPKLGFLDSQSLMWVVHGAYMEDWSPKASSLMDQDSNTLIQAVFKRFESELQIQSTDEDFTSIQLDIYTPTKHLVSTHLTRDAKQAIYTAIQRTTSIEEEDVAVLSRPQGRFNQFLEDFDYFYKVDCEEHVVPDNINAIAKYFREKHGKPKLGGLCIRLWPVPFEEKGDSSRLTYAIGLRRLPRSKHESEPVKSCAGTIGDYIMENKLQYDPASGLITISLVGSGAFEPLLHKVIDNDGSANSTMATSVRTSARDANSGRFRTAAQAISRLRHDPAHAAVEYDLGYEDRFEGMVWMSLEEWGGRETEAEDFIPEHRVRQLRRRADGRVVWDREQRVDRTGFPQA